MDTENQTSVQTEDGWAMCWIFPWGLTGGSYVTLGENHLFSGPQFSEGQKSVLWGIIRHFHIQCFIILGTTCILPQLLSGVGTGRWGESTDTAKVEASLKLSCAGNSTLLLLARNTLSHRTDSVYRAYAKFKLPLKRHFVGVTQGWL